MVIGILAIQGDFEAHRNVVKGLPVDCREIRRPEQLDDLDGLIIPGGESTTMLQFLDEEGFISPLKGLAGRGARILATCAGAILAARRVDNPQQPSLNLINIDITRNGYGRQKESFITQLPITCLGAPPFEIVCIRAPIIGRVGSTVEVLAEHQGQPILVRQENILAATFHPELTNDDRLHRWFFL